MADLDASATRPIGRPPTRAAAGDEKTYAMEAGVAKLSHDDARLVTAVDDDFPPTLRLIPNPPPFLFVRGRI